MVMTQHCAGRPLTQPEGQAAEKCLAGATGHWALGVLGSSITVFGGGVGNQGGKEWVRQ